MKYRKLVKRQKIKELRLVKVKEWKIEKILYKRIVQGCVKYLVRWKDFTIEYNTWENIKKTVEDFEERMMLEWLAKSIKFLRLSQHLRKLKRTE